MRVIMFQEQFADKVRNGIKNQTIRKSARCKAGDMLSLRRWKDKPYRSKQEVLRDAKCESVSLVHITDFEVTINGSRYPGQHMAVLDGFKDWESMRDWFADVHGLPFTGHMIMWETERREG